MTGLKKNESDGERRVTNVVRWTQTGVTAFNNWIL